MQDLALLGSSKLSQTHQSNSKAVLRWLCKPQGCGRTEDRTHLTATADSSRGVPCQRGQDEDMYPTHGERKAFTRKF